MTLGRYTKEKIYELLPSIYRIRDKEEKGEPLKALLEIIGRQIELVEEDIEGLYNNWFIETCIPTIVPYIGDLLGTKILNPVTRSTSSHRSWVANTISYRRRKGTLATIEQLSRDVTGWNCRAVEFFQNLIVTQHLNHLRLKPTATVNLTCKDNDLLELIDTPFDSSAHTLDVRNIDSKRGHYNIPNIGIFLWRLQAYPVENAPAFSLGDGKYTFSQLGNDLPIYNHPETETGIDHIATELNVPTKIRRKALKKNLDIYNLGGNFAYQKSIKIVKTVLESGKHLEKQLLPGEMVASNLSNWHYRPDPKIPKVAIDPEHGRIFFPEPEGILDVHVTYYYGFSTDVGGGFYDRNQTTLKDVILRSRPIKDIYHYEIAKKKENKKENTFHSLSEALAKWKNKDYSPDAIFEIIDSEIYADIPLEIDIPENITVVIKSENLQRPIFRLNKSITIRGKSGSRIVFDGILFILAQDSTLFAKGLYDISNSILKIDRGDLSELIINHCTLVPASKDLESTDRLLFSWEKIPQMSKDTKRLKMYLFELLSEKWIKGKGVVISKKRPLNKIIEILPPGKKTPSLKLELNLDSKSTAITVPSSTVLMRKRVTEKPYKDDYKTIFKLPILKQNNLMNVYDPLYSIRIFGDGTNGNNNNSSESKKDNNNNSLKVSLNRSIVGRIDTSSCDAGIKIIDCIIDGKGEIEAIRCTSASIENTTVFGKITAVSLVLASNSIFNDVVDIDRKQKGCVRFCYIPSGSHTPRPYRCIFEYESNGIVSFTSTNSQLSSTSLPTRIPIKQIRPQFTSTEYGDEGYGQLHSSVHQSIFEGADNRSEMGAFNHLYNPQRLKNLLSSFNEYLKFGLEAGIFLVS